MKKIKPPQKRPRPLLADIKGLGLKVNGQRYPGKHQAISPSVTGNDPLKIPADPGPVAEITKIGKAYPGGGRRQRQGETADPDHIIGIDPAGVVQRHPAHGVNQGHTDAGIAEITMDKVIIVPPSSHVLPLIRPLKNGLRATFSTACYVVIIQKIPLPAKS